jgi:UPF0176 protein
MNSAEHTVLLYYKYLPVEDPDTLMEDHRTICKSLNLKGRIITAFEGINGTVEGKTEDVDKYVSWIKEQKGFEDVHFKYSEGDGKTFPKLSVKHRPEIVAGRLGDWDIKPWETTGKYLTPEELHTWIQSEKKFFIVDMRNSYEHEVGYFKGSIFAPMQTFTDLPNVLPLLANINPDDPIVTVCTGGVRCEKASGFLVKNGFNNVFQLYGGIVSYMEKYPGEDFLGSLYTFDQRVVMAFNLDDPTRTVVGKCKVCDKPSENYTNCADPFCNRHYIACSECLTNGKIKCPMGCRDYSKEHPELFQNM